MSGIKARDAVEAAVRRELFGPSETDKFRGKPLDCSSRDIIFSSKDEARTVFFDKATGQEILSHTDPLHRYGVGVLYPAGNADTNTYDRDSQLSDIANEETPIPGLSNQRDELLGDQLANHSKLYTDVADSDDFDLSDANKFKPSAMAVSLKCKLTPSTGFKVVVEGAYYDKLVVHIPEYHKPFNWWVRRPFKLEGLIEYHSLNADKHLTDIDLVTVQGAQTPRVSPAIQVFSRPVPIEQDRDLRLLTISVRNTASGNGSSNALFQMRFSVEAINGNTIEPYPEETQAVRNSEEQSIDLLYRNRLTYAIGHGCSATWDGNHTVTQIQAEPMPSYEVPSLTPDIFMTGTRQRVVVSMRELALGSSEGNQQVEQVLSLYGGWIAERQVESEELAEKYQSAARRHLDLCREALTRMRKGWNMIVGNQSPISTQAFRLMNEAMLYQQLRSRLPLRKVVREKDGTLKVEGKHPDIMSLNTLELPPDSGKWRPFQIAFILAVLPELIERSSPQRSMVDLIFFPTGGGKTEAYLGASALSLLARRLRDPNDEGTDTIMRYTLRLLTTQQFQRAASLICVLEDIRSRKKDVLGSKRFGIGVWLGGDSTPNTWKQAVKCLQHLKSYNDAQNKFLLLRCPWCGAQMGPQQRPISHMSMDVAGYELVRGKVHFRCIDSQCRYSSVHNYLPVHVVDEDIYESRPSLIIGTVDKFAMLAWRPEARSLFGLGSDGNRQFSPPSLIIQDELHLISGPLGSMVGLYEPVIDDLCTDKRGELSILPKIIASTATARRYEEQILALFGRGEGQVRIFPPHGLEEGHSFFAEPQTLDDGKLAPGRRYLGVFSASLGSMQTVQVRVAASTLQAAQEIPKEDRDGYWTNLNFFNSLRELGNTVTLLQSDVPDYLTGLRYRDELKNPRWPKVTMELTSRRRNDEIPKAIEQLQLSCDNKQCIDICLASNIIEVGIDIDRLGLMTIVGQPKTTAQYIQVSGRVGRKPNISPGLVITIYGAAKPRDRSHFERFQTYHQQLYAQVEPTSVTPFAGPVLKRALQAAIVAYIRQSTEKSLKPDPFPASAFDSAVKILCERAQLTDPSTVKDLRAEANRRKTNWQAWERTEWSANSFDGSTEQGLMRYAGTLSANTNVLTWDVPTSMRTVDAECSLRITQTYANDDGENGAQLKKDNK
ncbi:helicase-related protein [Bifidobacterium mongoliense]|uniref:helicase-related protein n=1 Tax=Bifidobacterium mongoliense TaxID=518643 RepID=UPI0030EDA3A9